MVLFMTNLCLNDVLVGIKGLVILYYIYHVTILISIKVIIMF